jgi:hypothetical protein
VAVDQITDQRWCELFEATVRCPVLWQACDLLVRAMAAAPEQPVAALVAEHQIGTAPPGWRQRIGGLVDGAAARLYAPGADRLFRFAMGFAMSELRGRVPALDVADAVRTEIAAR